LRTVRRNYAPHDHKEIVVTITKTQFSRRAFLGGAAAFGVALASPLPALADEERTSADVQAEADAVRVKLDDMMTKLEEASDAYYEAMVEHDDAVAAMDEAQVRIDENNAEIADLQERLGGRARDMYRNGRTTILDVILGSNTFDDFLKNWDALDAMNQQDADLVAQTKVLREDNEAQRAEYEAQAEIAQEKMDEAQAIEAEAQELVTQYEAEVNALDAEVAELVEKERQAAAEAEAKRQAEELAKKQAEEAAAAAAAAAAAPSDNGGGSEAPANNEAPANTDSDTGGETYDDSSSDDYSEDTGGGYEESTSSSYSSGGSANYGAVALAEGQLGVPYIWGASEPGVGFDCSGLTSYCYGYSIPHSSSAQYGCANYILPLSQAEPGDVLYTGGHVGICASSGGGSYIHAEAPGSCVKYGSYGLFYCALRW
jgi:peptidoglycan hydrolase CwlO-like protein